MRQAHVDLRGRNNSLGTWIVCQTRETIHDPQIHLRNHRLCCAVDGRLCARGRWWRRRWCGWRWCGWRCRRRGCCRNGDRRRGICGQLRRRNGHVIQQRQLGAVGSLGNGDAWHHHRSEHQYQQQPEQSERSAPDRGRQDARGGASRAKRGCRSCAQWAADRQSGHRDQQRRPEIVIPLSGKGPRTAGLFVRGLGAAANQSRRLWPQIETAFGLNRASIVRDMLIDTHIADRSGNDI